MCDFFVGVYGAVRLFLQRRCRRCCGLLISPLIRVVVVCFFLRLFFHLFLFPRSSLTDDVSFAASNETLCVFGPFFVLFLMKAQQQQEETRQPTEIKRNSVRKKNPVKYIRSVMRNQLGPFEANQLRFDLIPMKNSVKLGKTR